MPIYNQDEQAIKMKQVLLQKAITFQWILILVSCIKNTSYLFMSKKTPTEYDGLAAIISPLKAPPTLAEKPNFLLI